MYAGAEQYVIGYASKMHCCVVVRINTFPNNFCALRAGCLVMKEYIWNAKSKYYKKYSEHVFRTKIVFVFYVSARSIRNVLLNYLNYSLYLQILTPFVYQYLFLVVLILSNTCTCTLYFILILSNNFFSYIMFRVHIWILQTTNSLGILISSLY